MSELMALSAQDQQRAWRAEGDLEHVLARAVFAGSQRQRPVDASFLVELLEQEPEVVRSVHARRDLLTKIGRPERDPWASAGVVGAEIEDVDWFLRGERRQQHDEPGIDRTGQQQPACRR